MSEAPARPGTVGGSLRLWLIVPPLLFLAMLALAPIDVSTLADIAYLPLVGIVGALIANTSGTGGGVVFVPVFNIMSEGGVLALSPLNIIAASFLIQCFGMSMGALRWTGKLVEQPRGEAGGDTLVRPSDYVRIILGVLALSLPVMLVTQRSGPFDQHQVLVAFKLFSIAIGTLLVFTTWTVNRNLPERTGLAKIDLIVLLLLAIPGGFVTALFSVGTGELVALYLFTRHYPILLATGTACCISAVSVLAGAVWHIDAGTVPWEVVALAAPGAMIGGFLARPLALWLGAVRLKTLGGLWIIGSSLYLIAVS